MPPTSSEGVPARERWNRRYGERGLRAFSRGPAEWLLQNRRLLPAGHGRRALDVASGGGRNAAYLAGLGFDVDAVDISDVAIDAVRAAAIDRGLAVNALRLDLERDPLPPGEYAVVLQIDYLQRDLLACLPRALEPDGVLLIETVTRAHAEELGNRFDPDFLLEPGELLRLRRGTRAAPLRRGRRRAFGPATRRRERGRSATRAPVGPPG